MLVPGAGSPIQGFEIMCTRVSQRAAHRAQNTNWPVRHNWCVSCAARAPNGGPWQGCASRPRRVCRQRPHWSQYQRKPRFTMRCPRVSGVCLSRLGPSKGTGSASANSQRAHLFKMRSTMRSVKRAETSRARLRVSAITLLGCTSGPLLASSSACRFPNHIAAGRPSRSRCASLRWLGIHTTSMESRPMS